MGGESQNSEVITGPYVRGVLNPNPSTFRQILENKSRSFLEIGCGEQPRISWKLDNNNLWVGCDPAIVSTNPSYITVHKKLPIANNAKIVVYSYEAAEIPIFKPDVLSVIAPNQRDVAEGRIFNSDLERFLDPSKIQHFIVVLDTRTYESLGYQDEAKKVISGWMREYGFASFPEDPILNKFGVNSADLGARNIRRCYIHNPRR